MIQLSQILCRPIPNLPRCQLKGEHRRQDARSAVCPVHTADSFVHMWQHSKHLHQSSEHLRPNHAHHHDLSWVYSLQETELEDAFPKAGVDLYLAPCIVLPIGYECGITTVVMACYLALLIYLIMLTPGDRTAEGCISEGRSRPVPGHLRCSAHCA